jgi:hypothetical protein
LESENCTSLISVLADGKEKLVFAVDCVKVLGKTRYLELSLDYRLLSGQIDNVEWVDLLKGDRIGKVIKETNRSKSLERKTYKLGTSV